MAVLLSLRWAGVTPEKYEAARSRIRWEEEPPPGIVMHAAAFDDEGIRVFDVWDTEADWERFAAEQLGPTAKEVGIVGEPETELLPLHRRFVAPGITGGDSL
jgi:hypothetical protein